MRPYKGYIKDDPNFKILFENTVMTWIDNTLRLVG